jgi:hypothetical protein
MSFRQEVGAQIPIHVDVQKRSCPFEMVKEEEELGPLSIDTCK